MLRRDANYDMDTALNETNEKKLLSDVKVKSKTRKFIKNVLSYIGWIFLGAIIFGQTDSHMAVAICAVMASITIML